MRTERKVALTVLAVVAIVVIVLLSSDVVEQEVAPQLQAVRVAIEVGDEGIARTGRAQIEASTEFRLHAVVRAKTFTGKTIYYTEAAQLEIDGERIPAESLRTWTRSLSPRILWFTVEGFKPYLQLTEDSQLADFRFQEHLRPDWPRSWSIPGDLRSRSPRESQSPTRAGLPQFGTQRYHVRVELFGPESDIIPRLRLHSLRAESLPETWDRFPTVTASLGGALDMPSQVFALTQIEPDADASQELLGSLQELFDRRLAFTRVALLRAILESSGTDFTSIGWQPVELGLDISWSQTGASPGDLLRVGTRWVSLLLDRGEVGRLDGEDLCLDFFKGAEIVPLEQVFTGNGLVEWARLGTVHP